MVVAALVSVDPIGWDHFGPIRWFLIPSLGFTAVAIQARSIVSQPDRFHYLWAGLIGWGLVATAWAVDPVHAWIGTPDRRLGFLTWILFGAVFLAARLSSSHQRNTLVKAMALGSVGLGLYTAAEWAGVALDVGFAGGRLGGPFGQPAYLGAAAALITPICVGVGIDSRSSAWWRAVGGLGACGGVLALLASQSRSAWFGAMVAGIVWIGLAIRRQPVRLRLAAMGAGVVVPMLVVGAVSPLRHRVTTVLGDRGGLAGRLDEWTVGASSLAESPLIGFGPEGYRTVFGQFVTEQYAIDWGRYVITDRAHSGILDVGLAFGVPGALAYLAIVVLVIRAALMAIGGDDLLLAGLGAGVGAYAIQLLFLFPLIELDPVFWLAAGLLVPVRFANRTSMSQTTPQAMTGAVAYGLMAGLAVVAAVAGALDLVANRYLAQAVDATSPAQANQQISNAADLRPDSIRYRFVAGRLARSQGELAMALAWVDDALRISPEDPALGGERARLQLDMARSNRHGSEIELAQVVSSLRDLVDDDPYNPVNLQRLGVALALSGDLDGAAQAFEYAILLAPDRPEPRINLAEIRRLQQQGRD